MSNLPTVDNLKASQRQNQKLATLLTESLYRETQLELLAEALRDERDEAHTELAQLKQKQGAE